MIACGHPETKKFGRDRKGNQRFRCLVCGKTWTEQQPKPIGTMRIPLDKAIFVLKMLLEGTSINATVRLTGVAKATILELLVLIGDRAQQFWADRMKGIQCEEVQVDEVWGFVGMKEKTRVHHHAPEVFGDAYCFTAIDRKTKLLVAFHIGKRTFDDAQWFFNLLADAIDGDLQLTTDGFMPYCTTIVEAFRHRVNFAQLIKIFGPAKNPGAGTYTPSEIKRTRTRVIVGKPDKAAISTSIVERSNRTWRMRCRRMTRLTDAHSKKWENHTAALALTFVAYNFVTVHTTLKTTPAVAHGLTDHPWTMEELLTELATHS